MAAKPKPSKSSKADNSYLESNKNAELEKKVDALLSVDSDSHEIPVSVTKTNPSPKPIVNNADNVDGPPLLPDDALPDVVVSSDKTPVTAEESVAPEPPKKKFYEPSGPKPTAPKEQVMPPGENLRDDLGLEDANTSKAVDEIIAAEADELLTIQDSRTRPSQTIPVKQKRRGLGAFLRNKYVRNTIIVLFLITVAVVAIFPTSRYYVLNAVGVRAAASVTVLDDATGQPLKNAEFSIDNMSAKSNTEGEVKLDKIKLGPQRLAIKKAGFADVSRDVTLGWGSNPLGDIKLKPVGSQYSIKVIDFLSKKPIAKVEATNGEASSLSNEKGEIVLTVPSSNTDRESVDVDLQSNGLRAEKVKLSLAKKDPTVVEMVPSQKHAFITKRSGTYDVYKVDADGKNEEKVLSGTGNERPESMALSTHPTRNIIALVSSRDSTRNKDGVFASNLTLINLDDNKTTTVTQSERIQMIGWVDNKLAYVKIAEGSNSTSPDRHRLVAYDISSGNERELASTNYFNDVLMAGKSIYYTPSSYNAGSAVGLYKTNIEGNDKKTVYDKEVWNLFRTSYDQLSVSMGQEWYTLNLSNDALSRAAGAPAVLKTRVYVTNPSNGVSSLWTDDRDGKGVLLNYNSDTKNDTVLQSKSGIKNPVRWLTDKDIIYRVSNSQETADYIMNTDGGEPRKVRDVTDTAGIDRWYYY